MQRSRFSRAARVGPTEETIHNSSNQAWQNQMQVNTNNYGGVKLYNPNDMAQQNYNANTSLYSGQPQNVWPNGNRDQAVNPSFQVVKPAQRDSYNGGQATADPQTQSHADAWNWGSTVAATEHHNNAGWTPGYPVTQQGGQTPFNAAYPQQLPASTPDIYNKYNDVWDWGKEDESGFNSNSTVNTQNPEVALTSSTYERNQQEDAIAQNMDDSQLNENYQRWNLAQHFQYDWSQGQQSETAPPSLSSLPSTLGQDSHIQWNSTAQSNLITPGSLNWTGDVTQNVEGCTKNILDNVASNAVNSDAYAGDATPQERPAATGGLGVGLCAADDQSSVSAYFQHGNDEDEEVKQLSGHGYSNDKKDDETTANRLTPNKTFRGELPTEPQANPPWASYLRADSWMSNSSLVTYNRSFTGSQEFLLSGSLYGGEDGAAGIAGRGMMPGLCQSVDDLQISSCPSRPTEMTHPLHISYSAREEVEETPIGKISDKYPESESENEGRNKDGESEPANETDVISDDGRPASNHVETNLEVIPSQSDNVEVPDGGRHSVDGQEEETKDKEPIVESLIQPWSQDDITNEEVPSSVVKESFKSPVDVANVVQKVSVAENVEVVEKRDSIPEIQTTVTDILPGASSWSRENSAFQSPVISNIRPTIASPVIQREILDDVPTRDNVPKSVGGNEEEESESANLEMVPDNAERPLDGDISLANKKVAPRVNRLTAHTSTARHRQADVKIPSPGTTLWDNPDLGGNIGTVLAVPAKGSNLKGPTQSALVVPKLAAQPADTSGSTTTASLVQPVPQWGQLVDNSLQRQMAVGGANDGPSVSVTTPPSQLDLSSRAAPQGRSFIDDESQRRGRLESTNGNRDMSDQQQPIQNLPLSNTRDMDGQSHPVSYSGNNSETDSSRQWRQGSRENYWRDSERDWDDRQRPSRGWDDDYNRRSGSRGGGGGVGGRRDEGGPPSDSRDHYGQSQFRRDSRDWDRDNPPQIADPYYRRSYPRPERDRSRPSSRASNQDYDSDRYYDRRDMYAGSEDGRGGHPPRPSSRSGYEDSRGHPPRPSSRSGYESDHGSDRQRGYESSYAPYNYYQRDPQYTAYQDYMRYQGNPYADPRQYPNPYYGMSNYDYGYYAELYGNDPRYRAYYDSVAKGYYWQQQQYQQRYDEYDRHSVHSGRSSVTDDSRNSQIRDNKDFSANLGGGSVGNNIEPMPHPGDQSALVYDDSYLSQSSLSEFSEQISAGVDILSQQRLTPAKFSIPHVRATFCPSGKLAVVLPNSIVDGQPPSVEICEGLCTYDNDEGAQQMNDFPGPLIRGDTHKNDVIQFCTQKIRKAKADVNLPDRESCILIWELLVLLVRQNGVVVGSDIAELLLKDHNLSEPDVASTPVINSASEETLVTETLDRLLAPSPNQSHDTNKFLEFLLYGHKKDALEWAMKRGIWGHALFLASKMDTRTYAMVMTRFANSLKFNHPLQTLYQLMSGRQPAAVTSIADEKWGDWRPHLAVILSNSTQRPELDRRSVVTLGDTLAAKGCLHAAHFCYLMAQLEFGSYAKKSSKLVLIGANHSLPFCQFATEEAIQCTEIYEYVQSLANPQFVLPHLQFYKFLYATRLVDAGYPQKALHYCEVVASEIQKWPHLFEVDLAHQLYELAYRLKYYDPHYTQEEGEVADMGDPVWLKELWNIIQSYNSGAIHDPGSDYLDQKLANDSTETSVTPDIYGLGTSTTSHVAESSMYQHQQYSYGQASTADPQTGYQEANQLSVNAYASQNRDGSNFVKQDEYTYQNAGNNLQQPSIVDDYQAINSTYNYDGYYGVPKTNFNEHLQPENTERVDPKVDYYGASTNTNAISSVNASSTPKASEHRPIRRTSSSGSTVPPPLSNKEQSISTKTKQLPNKSADIKEKPKQGGSWLGGIFSKFSLRPKNQMILPDDKNPKIVWDPKSGRWTNMEADEEEETNPGLAVPPKDFEVQQIAGMPPTVPLLNHEPRNPTVNPTDSQPPPPAPPNGNRYKLRPGRGMRNNYVDVLGGNVIPVQSTAAALTSLDPVLKTGDGNANYPVQFLIPLPVPGNENSPVDFVTTATNSTLQNDGEVANHAEQPPLRANAPPVIQQSSEQSDGDLPMMMYNPTTMTKPTSNPPMTSTGLQRYGRRPR